MSCHGPRSIGPWSALHGDGDGGHEVVSRCYLVAAQTLCVLLLLGRF